MSIPSSDVESLIKLYNTEKTKSLHPLELEVRLKTDQKSFDRLMRKLKDGYEEKVSETSRVESKTTGNITLRRITTNGKAVTQRKTRLYAKKYNNFNVTLSREEKYVVKDRLDYVRNRTRTSFVFNSYFLIDMTIVASEDGNDLTETFEVEIEYVGKMGNNFKNINEPLTFVFENLTDSKLKVNQSDVDDLYIKIKKVIPNFGYSTLVQSRNLKREDLVYDGIVGYYVTYKADGVRKLLILEGENAWLTYFPSENNLIYNGLKDHKLAIFDGELIDDDYYIFDTLVFNGKNVESQPYETRMKYAKTLNKNFEIRIHVKPFFKLTEFNFFDTMKTVLDGRKTLSFKEDGLMFIPPSQYNPNSGRHPIESRILTNYPDVCKWKEASNMTIDFRVVSQGGKYKYYSTSNGEDREVKDLDFEVNDLVKNAALKRGVVEFAYMNGSFVAIRDRPDKKHPNKTEVVNDNLKYLFDPITSSELSGKDDKNWIKRVITKTKSSLKKYNGIKLNEKRSFVYAFEDSIRLLNDFDPIVRDAKWRHGAFKYKIRSSKFFVDLINQGCKIDLKFCDFERLLPNTARIFCSVICFGTIYKRDDLDLVFDFFESDSVVEEDEDVLPWLPVDPYDENGKVKSSRAEGDDVTELLPSTSFYRIACIGDGSCLIHAILKAIYPPYQETRSAKKRIQMTIDFREGLARNVDDYYDLYESLHEEQVENPALIEQLEIDFSLKGLKKYFRSTKDLGEETIELISRILGITIKLWKSTKTKVELVNTYGSYEKTINISGNGTHFETMAVLENELFKTQYS